MGLFLLEEPHESERCRQRFLQEEPRLPQTTQETARKASVA
jgi:hypothetical protein